MRDENEGGGWIGGGVGRRKGMDRRRGRSQKGMDRRRGRSQEGDG